MGRQIEFYMTEEDEREFLGFLAGLGEARIDQLCLDALDTVERFGPGTALPSRKAFFWLWRPRDDSPPIRHAYGLHCVEVRSQGVELTRTSYAAERLSPGRIWMDTQVARPDHFVNWYQRMASWIRKHSERDAAGRYWAPSAKQRWPSLFVAVSTKPMPPCQ